MGKSPINFINGQFSIAMFDYRKVREIAESNESICSGDSEFSRLSSLRFEGLRFRVLGFGSQGVGFVVWEKLVQVFEHVECLNTVPAFRANHRVLP